MEAPESSAATGSWDNLAHRYDLVTGMTGRRKIVGNKQEMAVGVNTASVHMVAKATAA